MSTANEAWLEALAADVEPADVLVLQQDQPAIEEHRIADVNAAAPSVGDDRWVLNALGRTPGTVPVALIFSTDRDTGVTYHPERAETLKRIAYLLINRRVPATVAMAPDSKGVIDYVSATSARTVVHALRRFMDWAEEHYDAATLSDCTTAVMDQYANDVAQRGMNDSNVRSLLHPLYRLSQMAKWLPTSDRLVTPSWKWDTPGSGRVQTHPDGSATPIVEPEVLYPLLTWGLAFARDFAPDILSARDLVRERLASASPATYEEVFRWMRQYAEQTGGRIPVVPRQSRPMVALHYLSYLSGIDSPSLRAWLGSRRADAVAFRRALTRDADMPCPLDVTITGTLHDGLPWTDGIDFHDVAAGGGSRDSVSSPPLLQHLRSACFVALGLLSGCRPQELRTLPREECLVELPPALDGSGITGYLLRGTVRKGRRDGGDEAVWATIKPGADAARVAQALAGGSPWLFPTPAGDKPLDGALVNLHVREFIRYVNALPLQRRLGDAYRIGEGDADVTARQYRRTASWFIESQPEGEFALGVQFQHVSTTLGRDGYASMRDAGVKKMMDTEAAAAQQATLVAVSEAILGGAGVSGPSADRLMAAAQLAAPLRATYVAPQTLKRILSDTDAQVFSNPSQYSLCVYVPARAKCAGTDEEPDRGSCVVDCANHARTDIQMEVLASEVEQYRAEAASALAPEPVRVRLLQVAEDAQRRVEEHQRTRRYLPIVTITEGAEGGPDGS